MKIDYSLIDTLLYGEEGVDLDFKRDQYKFIGATETEKGELLKDILAFANSWRRSDAFILIGIEEVKGGRGKVHGIKDKLDDSQLQQFVNSKTNIPLTFSYQNINFENKYIGIIHIPIQPRPLYLRKDYGKLKKEKVYLRRGSSTDIAKLDEIAKMGNSLFEGVPPCPLLEVFFADIQQRKLLEDQYSFESLILNIPPKQDIPDYESSHIEHQGLGHISIEHTNYSYFKELAVFTQQNRLYTPIYFAIKNVGESVANDVRLEIIINDDRDIIKVIKENDLKSKPKPSYSALHHVFPAQLENNKSKHLLEVTRISDCWLIEAAVEKVQPKSIAWLENPLLIGALESSEFIINTIIYADNLSEPAKKKLLMKNQSETREVTLDEIQELEAERFRNSSEFEKFKKWHFEITGEKFT